LSLLASTTTDATIFLHITEHHIHMFIKGHELTDELAAVIDNEAHSIVEVLLHLTSLGRHCGREGAVSARKRERGAKGKSEHTHTS